jgi:serine/threonine-protein kinase HSL1 (negative regulator of Swe1 kinase)
MFSVLFKNTLFQIRMPWLIDNRPNEQKMFYSLLKKYRDAQLENYTPELSFSASDYHHVKEQTLTKTYSTCLFPQPAAKGKGHTRQGSRFTVVSNAVETERSYDPYKASRPQHLDSMRPVEHAKITIHRRGPSDEEAEGSLEDINTVRKTSQTASTPGVARKEGVQKQNLAVSRVIASRSSLASSTRSRGSGSRVRATVGHKRNVNFSHRRRDSVGSQAKTIVAVKPPVDRHSHHTEVSGNGGDSLHAVAGDSSNYIRSKKSQAAASNPLLPASKAGRGSELWTEDVRQLSSSLAMDCDAAFNRTEIETKGSDTLHPSMIVRKSSPLATQPPVNAQKSRLPSLDNRPLPPPPRSESAKKELIEARKQAELRKALAGDESPGHLDRMVSHIDRLMETASPDRRTASAPVESMYNASTWPLPSIHEAGKEDESPLPQTNLDKYTDLDRYLKSQRGFQTTSRIASAPEAREAKKYHENRFMRSSSGTQDTIRVVQPSSPSPVKAPAPLTIRKKSSQGGQPVSDSGVFSPNTSRSSSQAASSTKKSCGRELRQQYLDGSRADLERISEDHATGDQQGIGSSTGTVVKKKETWINRLSKLDTPDFRAPSESYVHPLLLNPPKKKGFSFGRLFKKRKPDMSIGGEYSQPFWQYEPNPSSRD